MKKFLAYALSFVMVFCCLPSSAFADGTENPTKKITFHYQSESKTATCYYTDDYFADSSYTYNPSLATMSVSYSMSAFGTNAGGQTDYTNKSAYAKQLLMDIGVEETSIETNNWFTVKPTNDSIGAIAGSKSINVNDEDYTLIALAIRGGGYESEWASSLTVGTSGSHQGFDEAKTEVIEFLQEYIEGQAITGKVKLWITGYSRAAAVANLVGGAIDDNTVLSNNITYDLDDVYTYCLETPAGALTSQVKGVEKYNNIFNIINSSDPTPYVAPATLGFSRYGVDYYLPSQESDPKTYSDLKANMLKIYNSLSGTGTYIVDDFQMKKLDLDNGTIVDDTENNYSQGLFLSNYISLFAKDLIKTRDNYVSNYQEEIREVCHIIFGFTSEQTSKVIDSFVSQAEEGIGDLLISYIWNTQINPYGSEEDAFQLISDWLKKAISDAGITDYNEDAIDSAGKKLTSLALNLVLSQPNYFVTTVVNLKGIGAAHYVDLCYAWLASMDENYDEGAEAQMNNGAYRIFFLNCNADVEVTDSNGDVVASIQDNTPDETVDSGFVYGVDDDGQMYVVLPIDEIFFLKITGTEDSDVNYTICEYSAEAENYTRNVSYADLFLGSGETMTGEIPSYSGDEDDQDGSDVIYTLYDEDGKLIASSHDTSGEDAINDVFKVDATSSDAEKGVALGSGNHLYGTFAQVEAVAKDGYKFAGWYKGEELVSSESTYRFRVTEDTALVAKFEADTQTISTNPKTGDSNYIWLWGIMLMASAAVAMGALMGVKKRK